MLEANKKEEFKLENKVNSSDPLMKIKSIKNFQGNIVPFNPTMVREMLLNAVDGLENVSMSLLENETAKSLYEGINEHEIIQALIMAARPFTELDPNYTFVTSRLLLSHLFSEAAGEYIAPANRADFYQTYFKNYLKKGIEAKRLNESLLTDYDLEKIIAAIKPERDEKFTFLGLQTLYDRYFIHIDQQRIELPQIFWMRVAMGLASVEKNTQEKTDWAIKFYDILSSFDYCSSTPTLFNSGTPYSQLSSCYLTTVPDDLGDIFKCLRDNALLSKFSGGLGNDWTPVRGMGALIKGTNGASQGVIPFLKVVNDTAIAVNQGGKRKGAVCSYLESWHIDVEEYLELRKNTGDDRRRCHDMNTANWIPDLFMQRVEENGQWTLFSPDNVPELHDLYGKEFEEKYVEYERQFDTGELKVGKRIQAVALWRKMLSMLFETGHPWITFKDPSNLRSPQRHQGVVHSSNLCTEILLNTSKDETAVCNLGSVNLSRHVIEGEGMDKEKLNKTISTAMRMLDNVIDQNFYPTPESKASNSKHRPVGLGIMGFQDALYKMGFAYDTDEAMKFADESMEAISYYAILSSSKLAEERGSYESFSGSLWDQGMLPVDTIKFVDEARGEKIDLNRDCSFDWKPVRESIAKHGMRNSNTMAIAPTATISNIVGVSQSIEPTYKNLYVKSNMSGEFTIMNQYLVEMLKDRELWDEDIRKQLKVNDGEIDNITRIPPPIKNLFKTSFDIEPKWLIEAAARRQKWIDMGQSLNLYIRDPNGKKLDEMYRLAWKKGLKTTYYLRALGASNIEKSTVTTDERKNVASSISPATDMSGKNACSILEPDCEACQ